MEPKEMVSADDLMLLSKLNNKMSELQTLQKFVSELFSEKYKLQPGESVDGNGHILRRQVKKENQK